MRYQAGLTATTGGVAPSIYTKESRLDPGAASVHSVVTLSDGQGPANHPVASRTADDIEGPPADLPATEAVADLTAEDC